MIIFYINSLKATLVVCVGPGSVNYSYEFIFGDFLLNQTYAFKIVTVGDLDCTQIFTNDELYFIISKTKRY